MLLTVVLCLVCVDQRWISEQFNVSRYPPNAYFRTMTNVVLAMEYPVQYDSVMSTRVSNALLVGEIIGQVTIGYIQNEHALTQTDL